MARWWIQLPICQTTCPQNRDIFYKRYYTPVLDILWRVATLPMHRDMCSVCLPSHPGLQGWIRYMQPCFDMPVIINCQRSMPLFFLYLFYHSILTFRRAKTRNILNMWNSYFLTSSPEINYNFYHCLMDGIVKFDVLVFSWNQRSINIDVPDSKKYWNFHNFMSEHKFRSAILWSEK